MDKSKTAIAYIINWNGMKFLPEILPTVLVAKEAAGFSMKVVLIDNQSRDASINYTQKNFSDIEVFKASRNGWLYSVNECLKAQKPDVFFLLNNDQKLDPLFFKSLMSALEDEKVAIAGGNVFNWKGDAMTLGPITLDQTAVPLSRGLIRQTDMLLAPGKKISESIYVSGGACAIKRDVYEALGGFDPVFYPGYFEDTDLCLRTWLKNYQVVFVAAAKSFHFGAGSSRTLLARMRVKFILARSEVFFNFKYQSLQYKNKLRLFFMKRLVKWFFTDWPFFWGTLFALGRLSELQWIDIGKLTLEGGVRNEH